MPFPDERRPVAVVDHRATWAEEFTLLAGLLRRALGELPVAVDHVGSTSVPGLPAKDCLDVQVRMNALDEAREVALLAAIGFRCRPEPWNRSETVGGTVCRKLVFAPPPGARACNVHLRENGGPNARYALLFRDYLRAAEPARRAWGAFKRRLAASVPDLLDYGRIKAPATDILMAGAERWAAETGWSPGAGEGVVAP
ncbi:GrpB family protein [Streptomyces sp. SBT349]|uniref:GrpB family protein n=1 Tax=Streptomyces sp. SBT349 TaxID=1580539 RepID=UPI00066C3652|nr:GrpB family protein [Streptomyces sp. SBT349]